MLFQYLRFKAPVRIDYALLILFTVLIASATAQQTDAEITAQDIVKRIDELYRSGSSHAEVEMEIVTPHWTRTLDMEMWTRTMEKTFVRIRAPKKEKGVATLRIENEMWNYLPKTNKVIKVPPSMMMGSWMGSDFTNDDLVKEFTLLEDYTFEMMEPEDADPDLLYVRATPRPDLPVVWARIETAVRRADYLPVWDQYYDEHNRPMRRAEYSDIREFSGKMLPGTMSMVPQTKEGHRTVVRYHVLELDIAVSDELFSLRNLRDQ